MRAKAAMNNHAEQFQFFAAAVLLNLVVRGPGGDSIAVRVAAVAEMSPATPLLCLQVAVAAGFHVVCRLVHLITYIEDIDWWRSTAFSLGFLTNLVLYAFAFAPDL